MDERDYKAMNSEKVVHLSAHVKRGSLPIKKKKKDYCSHTNVEVDVDEKELRCVECNAVVYPFDYVLSLAYEERKLFWEMEELRKGISELRGQKSRLEKDVANLKAAKRRLT